MTLWQRICRSAMEELSHCGVQLLKWNEFETIGNDEEEGLSLFANNLKG